jgi:hypothetical protein
VKKLFKSKLWKALEPIVGKRIDEKNYKLQSSFFEFEGIVYDFKNVSSYIEEGSHIDPNFSAFDYWDIAYDIKEDKQISLHQFVYVNRNLLKPVDFDSFKMAKNFLNKHEFKESVVASIIIKNFHGDHTDDWQPIIQKGEHSVLLEDIEYIQEEGGVTRISLKKATPPLGIAPYGFVFLEKSAFEDIVLQMNLGDYMRTYRQMGIAIKEPCS